MLRRKTYIAACILALAVVGYAVFAMWPPRPGVTQVTQANFERISVGMTGKEVDEILGGPSGNYASRPMLEFPSRKKMPLEERWLSDSYTIAVEFDKDRTVFKCHGAEPWFMRESFVGKLRRWLHLP
jgi:hypothetical protein